MNNLHTKQLVRAWLQRRQAHPEPPPELEQIRREVGWAAQEEKPEVPAPGPEERDVLIA
ncbi:MAG TPA: hypothetical protein VJ698_18975 [Noviherbaspirillum sp.]|uniref:hypothetical protein n=1 Tax=Noviherbaspirillum sp. TaxID=1926288 RepID=UPI002B490128|nr:hypothetical protein [Noviherbaspirillum sp.]HJV87560.1 hypothetical protein [Noviherbaspirillum sp.]